MASDKQSDEATFKRALRLNISLDYSHSFITLWSIIKLISK